MASAADDLESSIEIPSEMLVGDDLDFEVADTATTDADGATTAEAESDAAGAEGQDDGETEGQFLSDEELGAMGVERGSEEHKALEKKFFPLWQDRLRRAGLTEREIRERMEGKAPAQPDKQADDITPKPAADTTAAEAEPLYTWDDFKPKTDLSGILADDEAAAFDNRVREHIDHVVARIQQSNERVARQQAENEATEKFRAWAEDVKDSPALDEKARKAIMDFVSEPESKAMLLRNPDRFIRVLEAESGVRRNWRETKPAAEAPAQPTRKTPTASSAVTRSRPAAPAAPTKKVVGSYENLVADTLAEMLA